MQKAILRLSTFDYGSTKAEITIKFGGKEWNVKNWHYFSSPKSAENQAKKLAEKLGIKIIKTIRE